MAFPALLRLFVQFRTNVIKCNCVRLCVVDNGGCAGWQLVGDSNLLQNYYISTTSNGYKNPFALRVTMNGKRGWRGVESPWFRTALKTAPTAISFDARGSACCLERECRL